MRRPKTSLTATEIRYIQMYSDGLRKSKIAEFHKKTLYQVDGHLKSARAFMGAESMGHLIAECMRKNIIQ
jgi:DNA-binding CsgD family transcriptional regulator